VKNRKNGRNSPSDGYNFPALYEIGVAEYISGDKFTTASKINTLTAHAQTLSSQKPPKTVSRAGNYHVYIRIEEMAVLNSNMTLDFKLEVIVWSKLRMRSEKSPK